MQHEYTLGIAGLGCQGREHLQAASRLLDDGVITRLAVCDIDQQRWSAADGIPVERYDHHTEMFCSGLDGVVICVPNSRHASMTRDALRSDIHVLKEKPFALVPRQGQLLTELARSRNRLFRIAQQRLYDPFYHTARGWLDRIGSPRHIEYTFQIRDCASCWYAHASQGGGCWYGLGWHACWVLCFFGGRPEVVRMQQHRRLHPDSGEWVDDRCHMECRYSNGLTGRIHVGLTADKKQEGVLIRGDQGNMRLTRETVQIEDLHRQPVDRFTSDKDRIGQYTRQLAEFVRLSSNELPSVDPLTMDVWATHEAALQSAGRQSDWISVNWLDDNHHQSQPRLPRWEMRPSEMAR